MLSQYIPFKQSWVYQAVSDIPFPISVCGSAEGASGHAAGQGSLRLVILSSLSFRSLPDSYHLCRLCVTIQRFRVDQNILQIYSDCPEPQKPKKPLQINVVSPIYLITLLKRTLQSQTKPAELPHPPKNLTKPMQVCLLQKPSLNFSVL